MMFSYIKETFQWVFGHGSVVDNKDSIDVIKISELELERKLKNIEDTLAQYRSKQGNIVSYVENPKLSVWGS